MEPQTASPSTPAAASFLDLLSDLSRGLARARSLDELLLLSDECLRSAGLRACVVALDGDELHMLADPAEAQTLDTILGRSVETLGVRSGAAPILHSPAVRRAPVTRRAGGGPLLSMMPRLRLDAAASRRRTGEGRPFSAVPLEVGDDMVGVLVAWGGDDAPEVRPFLQVIAAQLASAWGRLSRPPEPAPPRDDHGRGDSSGARLVQGMPPILAMTG
ncbi:MAG: hypothetical protein ACRENL_10685 [Candidatus Dormibacteria bacterium]